jgi:hypothetical protein
MTFPWHRKVLVVDLIGLTVGATLTGHVATILVAAAPPPPPLHAESGPRAAAPPVRSLAVALCPDHVRTTGAHSYEVPRTVLDQILRAEYAPLPRVASGWGPGLHLLSVPRDSPLAAIGLVDGDRLWEINGRSLATPSAMLTAYSMLKNANYFWLVIERGGEQIEMDYVICGPGLSTRR